MDGMKIASAIFLVLIRFPITQSQEHANKFTQGRGW